MTYMHPNDSRVLIWFESWEVLRRSYAEGYACAYRSHLRCQARRKLCAPEEPIYRDKHSAKPLYNGHVPQKTKLASVTSSPAVTDSEV